MITENELINCNFCGKDTNDVFHMIKGETSNICNDCISLCADIVTEAQREAIEETTVMVEKLIKRNKELESMATTKANKIEGDK